VTGAQTGDLFIMKPRAGSRDRAWHTVIVVDHTVPGTVHTFLVDASWGTDLYGIAAGGVARRQLKHDTSNGKWWDIHPIDGSKAHENSVGPYAGHPVHGMFRAKHSCPAPHGGRKPVSFVQVLLFHRKDVDGLDDEIDLISVLEPHLLDGFGRENGRQLMRSRDVELHE
jgi:hypothetical protein